jgi:hypothetical protein
MSIHILSPFRSFANGGNRHGRCSPSLPDTLN